ncbi:hypothetical protein HPB49_006086 [Dermacentor silvarum]|uniref:Uncharacterized protein n=1 Tax=Dermacentor silvarum TaxID=543639 RepID=A0ACB8DVR8_DERSI|nr:hypothetical protein HPB49_006086 [Dermacentor silvarum]
MSKLHEECNNLKEDLSKSLTDKYESHARLDPVECEGGELCCEFGTNTHELGALISFYSNREKPVLRSPQALPQSPHSELEETTARSASDQDKMALQMKELEGGHACLKYGKQALEDRIGELNNQLELLRKSEEDYLSASRNRCPQGGSEAADRGAHHGGCGGEVAGRVGRAAEPV